MPDRFRLAAILVAATIILQSGLGATEDGLGALTGRRLEGQAFRFARPEPGCYSLTVCGHEWRWSEAVTVAALSAGDPGLAIVRWSGVRRFSGRVALGSVQAWREAIERIWRALRDLWGRRPSREAPPYRSPGPQTC